MHVIDLLMNPILQALYSFADTSVRTFFFFFFPPAIENMYIKLLQNSKKSLSFTGAYSDIFVIIFNEVMHGIHYNNKVCDTHSSVFP